MTNAQLHRILARIVRDLDAVSEELYDRAVEGELDRIHQAQAAVGQVCMVFLDSKQLEPLHSISDVYRRMPYSTTDENYITVADRTDIDGHAAERLCERVFSIKTGKSVKKGKQAA